jgi:Flp pilus assembly protein TadD
LLQAGGGVRSGFLMLSVVALLTAACARDDTRDGTAVVATASFTGSNDCRGCHTDEWEAWRGSHHDLAMDVATEGTVLGDFDDATFTRDGVTSRFFRREGRYRVRTDGPDGALTDFEITHVFGVYPLQQYLVPFPGGRYQALRIAWDARPREQGGQRWFHLYPGEHIPAGDELHWTGPNQNWNHMCSECHSTNLKKNYDAATNAYTTQWDEIDVACEACHGPGSAHVAWAQANADRATAGATAQEMGLQIGLRDRNPAAWKFEPEAVTATRSDGKRADGQVEMCGRCHARATRTRDDYIYGEPLAASHRVSTLDPGRYFADGQIHDEVYEYASFRQSRMYQQGVACSDCHNPHSLTLRAPGDQVCAQCHVPTAFASPSHHFHAEGGNAPGCVDCHMPQRTYMVVDPRRDHSIRVPRPDLSAGTGAPNACTMACHTDRGDAWAAAAATRWWPDLAARPAWGGAIHVARLGAPGAKDSLVAVATRASTPAVVRATALSMMSGYDGSGVAGALRAAAADPDPMVRLVAAGAATNPQRAQMLAPLLRDPVPGIRAEMGDALADAKHDPPADVTASDLDTAIAAAIEQERYNADRAFGRLNLGNLHRRLGDAEAAEREYRAAIEMEPWFVPGYVNLADLYREQGRDAQAEPLLTRAIAVNPDAATPRRALAMLLRRAGRDADALAELERALQVDRTDAESAYLYALALYDAGRAGDAIATLESALKSSPYHRETLYALSAWNAQRGEMDAARVYARRLLAIDPDDPGAQALMAQIDAARR